MAAPGGTTITLEDRSVMTLGLQPGTFPDCVSFEISRTSQFNPEAGLDENGDPVLVDLLTSYQFSFAVLSLPRMSYMPGTIEVVGVSGYATER